MQQQIIKYNDIETDFPGLYHTQVVDVGGDKTEDSATGLANDSTVYTANITIDGSLITVAVVGSAAQTYKQLKTQLNNDLSIAAYMEIVNEQLRITSSGQAGTVSIADVDLFSNLTGFVSVVVPEGIQTPDIFTLLVTSPAGVSTEIFITLDTHDDIVEGTASWSSLFVVGFANSESYTSEYGATGIKLVAIGANATARVKV